MWLEARCFQIFVLISIINGLPFRHSIVRSPYDVISEIMDIASPNPLIVYINPTDQTDNLYDEQEQQNAPVPSLEEDHFNFDHNAAKLESSNSLFNALIGNFQTHLRDRDKSPETQKEKELMITNALRSRCDAIVQCEEKCSRSEERKKSNSCSDSDPDFCKSDSGTTTPKPYCQKNCKAVFDYLIKCPPAGNKKKKKDQKKMKKKKGCGQATGKTLPPSWKKGKFADDDSDC